jgi:hypothetical protein
MSDPSEGAERAERAESPKQPGLPTIDTNEYGGKRDGARQSMNRRLFMQLTVFDVPAGQSAETATSEATSRGVRRGTGTARANIPPARNAERRWNLRRKNG